MNTTITKRFEGLKAAHRQWKHKGHCNRVHGERWIIDIQIGCSELDRLGFVIDFSDLKEIRLFLEDNFDHTLLLDRDDPAIEIFRQNPTLTKLVLLDSASAEGIAKFVYHSVKNVIYSKTNGRAYLVSVTVFEDEKNSATFTPVELKLP